ncbi:MAG: hydroxymethylbilane synthase [Solirubrobacterales bacterium]|nr:hydroxymethylbilane synthase [Solirubrobacterales bacterium]
MTQAVWVAELIEGETELVKLSSSPTRQEKSGQLEDKSRWVAGLEEALLEGRIDVAVHSAKDVPAELPEGLELVAIPPREDPRDAICGARSLAELPTGARVGTSSLRRTAQLRATRDDLEVVTVRGNVDTRLRKLDQGEFDALVLAAAGLKRLGHQPDGILEELVPAAGQGALALEAKSRRSELDRLIDPVASACVMAERNLTRTLGASCDTPVGASAQQLGDGSIELTGWVGLEDGSAWLRDRSRGSAEEIGAVVGARMLDAGARELLG